MIPIKTEEEIEKICKSSDLLVKTFRAIEEILCPGITTRELDSRAEEVIRSGGGEPAFKGYRGYPASICASIDEQVVHGIPGKRKLNEGNIIGLDIGVKLNGFYSDAAKTYAIGDVDLKTLKLMETTKEALYKGIKQCKAGNRVSDISHAIQSCVELKGYSVVRDLVGHGIGEALHESPQIPNFGLPHRGPNLEKGMVLAIEPMINMGQSSVQFLDDGWTVVTTDGSPSAHYEHTVLITEDGAEILTQGIEDNGVKCHG